VIVTLTLPYPPTANNLFLNVGKRRVRTKEYDAWIDESLIEVRRQKPAQVAGQYHMRLIADRPDRRARDIENLLKPASDLLTKAGVIEDDSKALSVYAAWSDRVGKRAPILITLEAA
jgi:crossover junction endodeoxyribonuclease RusA